MSASFQTIVSHNEIVMFCRKALEGLGISSGELEDAADAVGWLALHGIDSTTPFHQLLAQPPLSSPLQSINSITFDGGGNSCLSIGPTIIDIGFAQAMHQQSETITLKNCRHPLFLLTYLIRCASRGIHLAARWHEPVAQQEIVITIASGESFPNLLQTVADDQKEHPLIPSHDPVDLTLYFATNNPLNSTNLCAPHNPNSVRRDYSPAHFQAQRSHHIEHGIIVNATTWAAIQEIGKLVLVEATAESRRRGAGENA